MNLLFVKKLIKERDITKTALDSWEASASRFDKGLMPLPKHKNNIVAAASITYWQAIN